MMKSFISLDPTGQEQEETSDLTGSLADQAKIAHDKIEITSYFYKKKQKDESESRTFKVIRRIMTQNKRKSSINLHADGNDLRRDGHGGGHEEWFFRSSPTVHDPWHKCLGWLPKENPSRGK